MGRIIEAADLFCGGGGFSTGLLQAAQRLGLNVNLSAVNHDKPSIAVHKKNHPLAERYCTGLETVKPIDIVPKRYLDLLIASPECTNHSRAKGGVPRCDQSRFSGMLVLNWLQELYVKEFIMENVKEFMEWGPLGINQKPIKSKKGHLFQTFILMLKAMDYTVTWDVHNCANFGDATSRDRFFLRATKGRKCPAWPAQTHANDPGGDRFGKMLKPWKPAKEIIDWSLPGHSIFLTKEDIKNSGLKIKRPLVENTLKRLASGIEKNWGEFAEPFLVLLRGTKEGTLKNSAISIDAPIPTLSTSCGHLALCRPLIIPQLSSGKIRTIENSIPTITTTAAHAIVQAIIMDGEGFPGMPPFLVKYYGNSTAVSIHRPLDTLTTEDRFGLCRPVLIKTGSGKFYFDLLYRMLTPLECARAHSFPDGYFNLPGLSDKEIKKQIGNSVPTETATSMCHAALQRFAA